MGRPPSALHDDREWQKRLERYQGSDVDLDVFCLQAGVSRSTFYRWKDRLKEGSPKSITADNALQGESASTESMFLPVLRPVFTSFRDFDFETAIWDSPSWRYHWKRPESVLHR